MRTVYIYYLRNYSHIDWDICAYLLPSHEPDVIQGQFFREV